MNTPYDQIVHVASIGKIMSPLSLNTILDAAGKEKFSPAKTDTVTTILVCIDEQNDFMPDGSLGVPGADGDVERLTHFIYNNMDKITRIAASMDNHTPQQIFHPYRFIDKDGNHPAPFTVITKKDLDEGVWKPVTFLKETYNYVENLPLGAKKELVIWPYHCLRGTAGQALETQLNQMIWFHSVARKSQPYLFQKGSAANTEMYGIIRPEYDHPNNYYNIDFLNIVHQYDRIVIAGEAKSHCVLESIRQILDHYKDDKATLNKIYILEDCMSSIPGFEAGTETEFAAFKAQFGVNIVKSTDSFI